MPVENLILRFIILALIAYGYGVLVQHVLGYDRGRILLTLSIGVIGMIIGKYLLPSFLNIHVLLHVGGVPLISSLIGSFILPGLMWILRSDKSIFQIFRKRD